MIHFYFDKQDLFFERFTPSIYTFSCQFYLIFIFFSFKIVIMTNTFSNTFDCGVSFLFVPYSDSDNILFQFWWILEQYDLNHAQTWNFDVLSLILQINYFAGLDQIGVQQTWRARGNNFNWCLWSSPSVVGHKLFVKKSMHKS